MTRPPIRALLEWHARQFFCRMGATCESKPGVSAAIAAQIVPHATASTTKQRAAFTTDRQFHRAFRILVVKHEFLAGQQRPGHVVQRSPARIIHPGGLAVALPMPGRRSRLTAPIPSGSG